MLNLKHELSQIFAPAPVAQLMARMLHCSALRLLDAGAGVGNLTQAVSKWFASVCLGHALSLSPSQPARLTWI